MCESYGRKPCKSFFVMDCTIISVALKLRLPLPLSALGPFPQDLSLLTVAAAEAAERQCLLARKAVATAPTAALVVSKATSATCQAGYL